MFSLNIRMGEEGDFGTTLVSLSVLISRDFHTKRSLDSLEWCEKQKTEHPVRGGSVGLVDERDQRRTMRPVGADRKATVTQIRTRYNRAEQKRISERTTRGG